MNRLNSIEELETEYNSLNVTKYKLDTFFDLFLDKFDTKLRGDRKKDDPHWKLYDEKFKEYEDVTRAIAHTKYLLSQKGKNV
jgi:hypothetical protein